MSMNSDGIEMALQGSDGLDVAGHALDLTNELPGDYRLQSEVRPGDDDAAAMTGIAGEPPQRLQRAGRSTRSAR